jgi:Nucleotidyltransferase domain
MISDPKSTSIWIYGSSARGDVDELSDIDVLVAGGGHDWEQAIADNPSVAALSREGREVSTIRFTWAEVDAMARYGSLFLHHLRLEARSLTNGSDDRLAALLVALPAYQRAQQEMFAFSRVLDDVRASIRGRHSPAFELAVIATALRHAFILGCYVTGQPDFGRITPFRRLCRTLELPDRLADDLGTLYQFRLYQHLRAPEPFTPTQSDVQMWLTTARELFSSIQEKVDVFDRTVHQAA